MPNLNTTVHHWSESNCRGFLVGAGADNDPIGMQRKSRSLVIPVENGRARDREGRASRLNLFAPESQMPAESVRSADRGNTEHMKCRNISSILSTWEYRILAQIYSGGPAELEMTLDHTPSPTGSGGFLHSVRGSGNPN